MSELFNLPAGLKQVEYAQLFFSLELSDYFDLPRLGLLQLRRELLQALKRISLVDADRATQLKDMLQPPESQDPQFRKRFKKPAPGFVLAPDPALQGLFQPTDNITLPILFLGPAVRKISEFSLLLESLGQIGLFHGNGQFRLAAIESVAGDGLRSMLWRKGEPLVDLLPPVSDLQWWLELQPLLGSIIELEVFSPMRLLHQGKPLFQADFSSVFPFLLRRVTAMLAWYGGIEPVEDPVGMVALATQVEVLSGQFKWADWRRLKGDSHQQDLGGLLGKIRLAGPELMEIAWLLQLGSLFQVGRGAAFGAGQYRLRTI